MRRALTVGGLVLGLLVVSVAGAIAVQGIYGEREYRRLLAVGDSALAAGDAYAAVEAFSGALAFRPESMVAYLRRGQAYREQRRLDEAVRDWRHASRLAPEWPQPLMALGDLFDSMGQAAEADRWYSQAADRLKDEDPDLLYRLALARFKAGSPGAALQPLEAAVARRGAPASTRYLLGLVHRDTGNVQAAIAALEDAVSMAPDLIAAREELADAYRAEGRAVEEIAQLQALAARDPDISRRVAIANAEARQGQLDAALGTLTTALNAAPTDSRVLLAIGRVYLARSERTPGGHPESVSRAVQVLERALGGTAPRSEGLALYGRALYLSGDYLEAERILGDAVATTPVDPEAFLFLADVAERLNHDLIARDALLNFDALQGDLASAQVRASRAARIGHLSLRAGDHAAALRHLSRAVDAGQTSPPTLGRLAHARWLTGDQAGARDALARALAASPGDAELQRIARVIR